ncbi:MAG: hypothetical protein L3J47_00480 [Sulfurovum sp.]|nr:hypothetical protein [Sulfurovum sp.]
MRSLKDLTTSDFVRVVMKARAPLVYQPVTGGFNLTSVPPSKRDRVWERGVIEGGIQANLPSSGMLHLGVTNVQGPTKVFTAFIPYQDIVMVSVGTVVAEIVRPEGLFIPQRIRFDRVTL